MTLAEAKPGDVLRDTDGDFWWRGTSSVVLLDAGCEGVWELREFGDAESNFGPFVLVRTLAGKS